MYVMYAGAGQGVLGHGVGQDDIADIAEQRLQLLRGLLDLRRQHGTAERQLMPVHPNRLS